METFSWFNWVILPLIIFFTRILDVTLGTLRIIFIARGRKYLAPLLGFVEVFIWITVVSQIVGGAHNFIAYLAYAAGFATGNYVGMMIEEKLAIGTLVVRVILSRGAKELVGHLRTAGFGVTHVDAQGASGPVILVYTVVMRKELERVIDIIDTTAPKSFFTIEELRTVKEGIFPARSSGPRQGTLFGRKSK